MLENLTDKLSKALRNIAGVGKLTEENMEVALKEVRTALLSADVHFKVAREFIERVKEKCLGEEVLKSITPGQQVIKIINDELVSLLGEGTQELSTNRPLKIMLVGLHGSGKTTSTAKLARLLTKKMQLKPLLVGCDVYRPAAIDQLEMLANQEGFRFFSDKNTKDVLSIAKRAVKFGKENEHNAYLFDTAGRLQIDEDLIEEIIRLKKEINPDEVFLVGDSALGQEAVNVAKHFHEAVSLTGIILTKLDGDARGGAALSMKSVTGVPIRYIGFGEKPTDFDTFHPDRMASRILGMGDVVSLVEQAQENIDQKEAERMAKKMRKADFNFEDMLMQFQQLKKLGSLGSIAEKIPGLNQAKIGNKEEDTFKRYEAIIQSMTVEERQNPKVFNGSRRLRIAEGAGVEVRDVNALIKQFSQMRKMMKAMKGKKGMRMMEKFQGMGGGMPGMPGMPKLR